MRRVVLPTAVILTVALAGCFGSKKNPVKAPVNPPFAYSRATPQDVLESLTHAYGSRDSAEYARLYAYDYQGASYDTGDAPGSQAGTFSRLDEERHIKALAEDADVLAITLNLGPRSSWIRTAPPGPNDEGWAEMSTPPDRHRHGLLLHGERRDLRLRLLTRNPRGRLAHRHALVHRAVVRDRSAGTMTSPARAA